MTLRLRTSVKVFRLICKQNVANAETAAVLPRAVAFGDTPTIDFGKTYKPHFQRFQLEFLTNSGYMLNDISIYIYMHTVYYTCNVYMYICMYIYIYHILFFLKILNLCLIASSNKNCTNLYGTSGNEAPQREPSSEPPRRKNHSSVHQPVEIPTKNLRVNETTEV